MFFELLFKSKENGAHFFNYSKQKVSFILNRKYDGNDF